MPWPTRTSQRFTPPTCSLEISARVSALSQWSDRPVWKQVRFQLQFDDPRITAERHQVIRGDRRQLEALIHVLEDYIQGQLGLPSAAIAGERKLVDPLPESSSAAHLQLVSRPALSSSSPPHASAPAAPVLGLALQSRGLTRHELVLGDLATADSGTTVMLNTTQLFDLATALDEYQTAGLSLPALKRQPAYFRQWGAIAASVLLTVAVAPTVYRRITSAPLDSAQVSLEQQPDQLAGANSEAAPVESAPINPEALTSEDIPPDPNSLQTLPPLPPPTPAPATPAAPARTAAAPADAPAANPPGFGAPINPSANPDASGQSGANNVPDLDIVPNLDIPPVAPSASAGTAARSAESAAEMRDEAAIAPAAPTTTPAPEPTPATLFDTRPQIAEARSYLQQRWSPPADLTQTLEYRVTVDNNGAVQQISPLGDASAVYQGQSGLPSLGEAWVAPLTGESSLRLRVVLSPNGTVRTFQE